MGVKDLWNVLTPVCEKKSLFELQDKTVAIDLSCWVCENQAINDNYASSQPRMYLRNLFFRTSTLLLMNIKPVFVLDGTPPELKHGTIKNRNAARYNRSQTVNSTQSVSMKATRQRHKSILKQCEMLLQFMGLECLQSDNEAEALCAHLNLHGKVDGVITQDSDIFLYGATTVYRNFTIQKGCGSVEVYTMENIEKKLNLNRCKLIAMSLLCGCDYKTGVDGIGKETSFKYLSKLENEIDVLDRIRNWRQNEFLDICQREKSSSSCSKCFHYGKQRQHTKEGCQICGTTMGCLENLSKLSELTEEDQKIVSLELNMRSKALIDPSFPDEEVIAEFLQIPKLVSLTFKWNEPNIYDFIKFTAAMLQWDISYALEKVFPLKARWHILNLQMGEIYPERIIKRRILKGVPSFEVMWDTDNEDLKSLISLYENSEDCTNIVDGKLTSIEPQQFIIASRPDLVKIFEDKRKHKKKKPKQKKLIEYFKVENSMDVNSSQDGNDSYGDFDVSSIVDSIVSRKFFE